MKDKNFYKWIAHGIFYRHNRGLRLAKGAVSAQTEARRVVCCVNDGSKTDSYLLAFGLAGKEYKLGTKK
jgi:hypothetical protein